MSKNRPKDEAKKSGMLSNGASIATIATFVLGTFFALYYWPKNQAEKGIAIAQNEKMEEEKRQQNASNKQAEEDAVKGRAYEDAYQWQVGILKKAKEKNEPVVYSRKVFNEALSSYPKEIRDGAWEYMKTERYSSEPIFTD